MAGGPGVFGQMQANLYAGTDPATGKPFYLQGYGPDMRPVFTFSPVYDQAAAGGVNLNRSIGHFQDATQSGGQFDPSGAFVSKAQGSMYTPNNTLTGGPLTQTGTYQAPGSQPPPAPAPAPAPAQAPPQQQQAPAPPMRQSYSNNASNFTNPNPFAGLTNPSGPFQGGLTNSAVYRRPENTGVPWQMRLQGGGGTANDRPGFSASRLF